MNPITYFLREVKAAYKQGGIGIAVFAAVFMSAHVFVPIMFIYWYITAPPLGPSPRELFELAAHKCEIVANDQHGNAACYKCEKDTQMTCWLEHKPDNDFVFIVP